MSENSSFEGVQKTESHLVSIAKALKSTILSPKNFSDLLKNLEFIPDSQISDDLIRSVPLFGSIITVSRMVGEFRNYLLIEKIIKFLRGIDDLSLEEREELIQLLESEDSYFAKNSGERLLEILDRIELNYKPEILANIMKNFVRQEIDKSTFYILSFAIERIPVSEIRNIRRFYENCLAQEGSKKTEISPFTYRMLANSEFAQEMPSFNGQFVYQPTYICEIFVKLNLDTIK